MGNGHEDIRESIRVLTWFGVYSPYNGATVRRGVPAGRAGVYCLYQPDEQSTWKVFYVGKTEDLQGRLLEHIGGKERNPCIKETLEKQRCGFAWLEVTTITERAGAEKFLYDKLKPRCNDKDPGGEHVCVPPPPHAKSSWGT
jgi:hypothetical protein